MSDVSWKNDAPKAPDAPANTTLKVARAIGAGGGAAAREARRFVRWAGALPRAIRIAGAAGLVSILLIFALFQWLAATLPLSEALKPLPSPGLTLVGTDGTVFARRGGYKEDPVSLEEVPPHLIDALLSMEDRRFRGHLGVDTLGMLRAAWRNYQAGRIKEGGSTITQQLARITFLSHKRTYRRKMREALLALWLETQLSKEEILVRYLSSVYFGSGAYGLRAAARHYFDKEVQELTLGESAMLVGVLRAPSRLAPTRDLEAAQARARLVLSAMVDNGKLTERQAAAIEPAMLAQSVAEAKVGSYFADWVVAQLPDLEGRYGDARITTTLDPSLQRTAQAVIGEVLAASGAEHGALQAALVAMRPDGRVVAMVGGRDYSESQFNRASQAVRQPGSAFKLFVYLAALRDGASPRSTVPDVPIEIDGWRPENFSGRHRGRVSIRRAFASSINTSAVIVSETAGRKAVIRTARDLGISSDLKDTPALALGASEVTPLELTAAYAAIAARRYPVRPRGVTAIDGVQIAEGREQHALEHADEMTSLLRAVVQRGTGRSARLGIPAYGKTGTSEEYRDAWFVGYAGNLVTGVWVGNDDNAPMDGVTGGSLPAQIWHKFMAEALESEAVVAERQDDPPRRRRGGSGALRGLLRSFGL